MREHNAGSAWSRRVRNSSAMNTVGSRTVFHGIATRKTTNTAVPGQESNNRFRHTKGNEHRIIGGEYRAAVGSDYSLHWCIREIAR